MVYPVAACRGRTNVGSAWTPLSLSPDAYWKLDETSGNRADSAGSSTLVNNGSVGSAAGRVSNAASFTAASAQFFTCASSATLQTGDIDFTVAGWVYLASKTTGRVIIQKGLSGSLEVEYQLRYDAGGTDRFVFDVWTAGPTSVGQAVANNLGSPSTATWYFIVAWHDAANNVVGIQVNNGTANTAATTGSPSANTRQVTVGRNWDATNYMDGRIDELFFKKAVLTAQQKTLLYQYGGGT